MKLNCLCYTNIKYNKGGVELEQHQTWQERPSGRSAPTVRNHLREGLSQLLLRTRILVDLRTKEAYQTVNEFRLLPASLHSRPPPRTTIVLSGKRA